MIDLEDVWVLACAWKTTKEFLLSMKTALISKDA